MIGQEVALILEEAGLPPRSVASEDRLSSDLGLKSLDLARIVAELELKTRADPFQELVLITSVRTIGDLERAYRRFFAGESAEDEEEEELAASQRRGAARKSERGGGV